MKQTALGVLSVLVKEEARDHFAYYFQFILVHSFAQDTGNLQSCTLSTTPHQSFKTKYNLRDQ